MSYLLKSSPRGKTLFPFPLKVVSVVVIFLVLIHLIFPQALSRTFTSIISPLWGTGKIDMRIPPVETDALQKENEELKILLGRSEAPHPLLATVLKKPPFSAYDTFILDVGEDHGVSLGNMVYAMGNIPIGEIAEVNYSTSKVKLYSSYGQKWNVFIGDSHIEAEALGKGGGTFEVVLPRGSKVKVGDLVVSPSLNGSFAGKVMAIVSDPSEPFSTILFQEPVNIYELRWVLVSENNKKINGESSKK